MRTPKFNFCTATDSYKFNHYRMMRPGVTHSFAYLEARAGGVFSSTMFFGLQRLLLRYFEGQVFTQDDIEEAALIANGHFGKPGKFNRAGWERLLRKHGGRLPIRIMAVPEGTIVPNGNVMMTVENLDPEFPWLAGHCESILLHVWYTCTVATLSGAVRQYLNAKCKLAGGTVDDAKFMLHDFGYRGVSGHESAGAGGAAHLINFYGTDTVEALRELQFYYGACYESLAWSVDASEHSVMTPDGPEGEYAIVDDLIANAHDEILSVVADSYNVYNFVDYVLTQENRILRNGIKFVVRPDSVTPDHDTPEALVVWILDRIWAHSEKSLMPGTLMKGTDGRTYKLLPAHFRVLWGDGIDIDGIKRIVEAAMAAGYAPQNLVFGMGGGLLQKVNRDTQRFAFKLCAQKREGQDWKKVVKNPLGSNKASKGGRLMLRESAHNAYLYTVDLDKDPELPQGHRDMLRLAFENGFVHNCETVDAIRARAASTTNYAIV